VDCRLFRLRFNLIMLFSAIASNFFFAQLSIFFYFFFFADARLRARLRCNNGLLVNQHKGFVVGVLVNQPKKTLSD